MTGYRVLQQGKGADGAEPPYSTVCLLEFKSAEAFQAALKAEAGPVMADVPNFSNVSPVRLGV